MESDKGRVLLADDEDSIVDLFRLVLLSGIPDIAVDAAQNGKEAVRAFAARHHAVILMDLHMPLLDGQGVFNRIMGLCEERRWTPPSVIFCTGFAPPETVRRLVSRSALHLLLRKPVTNEALVEAVKSRLA